MSSPTQLAAWLFAAFACLVCTRAQAAGFATTGLAPDHSTAVTTTPVASYTNPAALRVAPGLRLFLDATLAYRVASYKRASSDVTPPAGSGPANTGTAHLHNLFGVPTISAALGTKQLSFGLGAFVPFGGAASWDKRKAYANDPTYVGAVDSPARWHAIEGVWATGYVTLAMAYQLPNTGLSFGASGNFVYTHLELSQAATASLDDNLLAEGRMNAKLTGSSGSFGLGVHWEAVRDRLWLGASYQAPPGLWNGTELKGPLRTNFGTGVNEEPIRLRQEFPDIVQAGIRMRPSPSWELRLSGNYARFSAVKSQCLARGTAPCRVNADGLTAANSGPFANFVRNWKDSGGVRLAASRFLNERWELLGALAYDGTAVRNSTLEPGLLDGRDFSATVGGKVWLTDQLLLGASYTHQVMVPRDNRGESELADFETPNALPSANGLYKQWIALGNVYLEARFDVGL